MDTHEKHLDLIQLTIPILIETTLFMLLGFVDVFLLGHYNDLASAGVNTANQIITIVSVVFLVFTSAGGILITQNLGAGDIEDASQFAALSIVLHLISGAIISLVVVLFSANMLSFLGATGEVFDYAHQYLSLVGGFLFLHAVLNSMSSTIRSHGRTKEPMLVAVGVNIVNIILDIALIPGMGAVGSAIATIVSRFVGVVALAIVLFTQVEKLSIFRLLTKAPAAPLKQFFQLGFPSAAEAFLYHMSQLIITALVLRFLTENDLVAKTYVSNIAFLFYLFSASIGQAAQIIVGHLVGTDDHDATRALGYRAFKLAITVTVTTSLLGILFREQIISLFTSNPKVIEIASTLLIINLFLELGRTTNLTIIPCLRAAGDVKFPTLWAIFSNWAIGLGGAQLLAVVCGFGIYGLWIAMAADEVFRAIIMLLRWRSPKWENKAVY